MNKFGVAGLVSGVLALAGCGGSSSSTTDTGQESTSDVQLNIPFKAVVGSEPVACGTTYSGLGTAGTDARFRDFRVFVHDLALVTDQGEVIPVSLDADADGQNADVALLDFRDKAEINETGALVSVCELGTETAANPGFKDAVQASVTLDPSVTVQSVQFTIGVPFELNHASQTSAEEPLRSPGQAAGMTWNWQNGYKFLAADVFPIGGVTRASDPTWSNTRWNIHLGSTGCEVSASELEQGVEPETCADENRRTVTLPVGAFALEELAIQIDYAALVSGSNLGQDDGGAPGCMSGQTDPECDAIFERLALPWGGNSNDGGNPNAQVFSIVER
ncbi:MbnP family copper-binding protein [Marinobacter sp. F3R08]|uniref:MbnP family copper-binding protein n=1 Tax=Marinobacter sp. F3R08 TaxID=2841559 RepID=UPI001C08A2F0|nr:MbnP family copper-binding protein [Marinobacter sp. F3R08]MBU2953385.1 metallo-mystery pair system four-Cys motif protein [Marinobacter sp. F3R08]